MERPGPEQEEGSGGWRGRCRRGAVGGRAGPAGVGQYAGVHGQDVCHGEEGGGAGADLGRECGFPLCQFEVLPHAAFCDGAVEAACQRRWWSRGLWRRRGRRRAALLHSQSYYGCTISQSNTVIRCLHSSMPKRKDLLNQEDLAFLASRSLQLYMPFILLTPPRLTVDTYPSPFPVGSDHRYRRRHLPPTRRRLPHVHRRLAPPPPTGPASYQSHLDRCESHHHIALPSRLRPPPVVVASYQSPLPPPTRTNRCCVHRRLALPPPTGPASTAVSYHLRLDGCESHHHIAREMDNKIQVKDVSIHKPLKVQESTDQASLLYRIGK
ncbi:hypothetical protein Syun_000110 [Stephania yunnanensis]|uniref:Uncharacterized protein n=1 Tax=Stephania yunnanensis TaxID=152371 RepID=A0AAP0LE50_9MAGN